MEDFTRRRQAVIDNVPHDEAPHSLSVHLDEVLGLQLVTNDAPRFRVVAQRRQ
jgi:hypothetical protein